MRRTVLIFREIVVQCMAHLHAKGQFTTLEAHVADVVVNEGVGMGSAIVQGIGDGFGGGLYSLGMGGRKGAKGDDKGRVDGTSVV
jgi:hypothetical protein